MDYFDLLAAKQILSSSATDLWHNGFYFWERPANYHLLLFPWSHRQPFLLQIRERRSLLCFFIRKMCLQQKSEYFLHSVIREIHGGYKGRERIRHTQHLNLSSSAMCCFFRTDLTLYFLSAISTWNFCLYWVQNHPKLNLQSRPEPHQKLIDHGVFWLRKFHFDWISTSSCVFRKGIKESSSLAAGWDACQHYIWPQGMREQGWKGSAQRTIACPLIHP
jgi:hypothetical protein